MAITTERSVMPLDLALRTSAAHALVTVDSKLPAVVPAADLARAIEVKKTSQVALAKASYGKGDFVADTRLQKFVKFSDKLLPQESFSGRPDYSTATLTYGFGGVLAGVLAMGAASSFGDITALSMAVGAATAVTSWVVPVANAILRALGRAQTRNAADKLIAPNGPKPLEQIAATGNATDVVLAGLEAKRWLASGSAAHALSPDARFALEDLIEAQAEVDPALNDRTVKVAQLAELVMSTPTVTPSTVRAAAAIIETFDSSEQKDLRRAVLRVMSERTIEAQAEVDPALNDRTVKVAQLAELVMSRSFKAFHSRPALGIAFCWLRRPRAFFT